MEEKRIGNQEPTIHFALPYEATDGQNAIELYELTGRTALLNDPPKMVHRSTIAGNYEKDEREIFAYALESEISGVSNDFSKEIYRLVKEKHGRS